MAVVNSLVLVKTVVILRGDNHSVGGFLGRNLHHGLRTVGQLDQSHGHDRFHFLLLTLSASAKHQPAEKHDQSAADDDGDTADKHHKDKIDSLNLIADGKGLSGYGMIKFALGFAHEHIVFALAGIRRPAHGTGFPRTLESVFHYARITRRLDQVCNVNLYCNTALVVQSELIRTVNLYRIAAADILLKCCGNLVGCSFGSGDHHTILGS